MTIGKSALTNYLDPLCIVLIFPSLHIRYIQQLNLVNIVLGHACQVQCGLDLRTYVLYACNA